MADKWLTKVVPLEGGLIDNSDSLVQGTTKPGSAINLVNFEPSVLGGYRRISGFAKFDTAHPVDSSTILGVKVFNQGVVAAQGANFYYSTGSGWTKINGDVRSTPTRVRFTQYHWTKQTLALVDGTNQPATYKDDGTYTLLTTAPAGQLYVAEHKQHLFMAAGQVVNFSAPNDETNWTAGAGAGSINVGFLITGLKEWRGNLYVFGVRNIAEITGSSLTDFAVSPVTDDLGCLSGDSIWEVGGDLLYLGNDGLRTLGGTNRIGDFELATISKEIQDQITTLNAGFATSGAITAVTVRSKSQYRIFFNVAGTTESLAQGVLAGLRQPQNTAQVAFFQDQLNWEFALLQGIKPYCCDSDYTESNVEKVVHGGYDGFVYVQESGGSFNGANVFAIAQTPFMPLDDAEIRKTIYKATVYTHLEGNANVTAQLYFDFNDPTSYTPPPVVITNNLGTINIYDGAGIVYDTAVYDQTPNPQVRFPLIGSGRTVSFAMFSNDTNPPYTLRALQFQYGLGGRR